MLSTLSFVLSSTVPPEVYAASDGTLWRTQGQALLWDFIERKWRELLSMLQNGQVVRETRESVGLSQADLARAVGISQPMLCGLESGKYRISEATATRLWAAMWHIDQARKGYTSPEILVRIEKECAVVSQVWRGEVQQ